MAEYGKQWESVPVYRNQTQTHVSGAMGATFYFCQVCKASCYNEQSWNVHVSSADHVTKLKSYEKTVMGVRQQSKPGQIQLPLAGDGGKNSHQSNRTATGQYYQGQAAYEVTSGQDEGYAADPIGDDLEQYDTYQDYYSSQGQYVQYEDYGDEAGVEQEAEYETAQPHRATPTSAARKRPHYADTEELYAETHHKYDKHGYEESSSRVEWQDLHPQQRRPPKGDKYQGAEAYAEQYYETDEYAEQYHETVEYAEEYHDHEKAEQIEEEAKYRRPSRSTRGGVVYTGRSQQEAPEGGYAKTARPAYRGHSARLSAQAHGSHHETAYPDRSHETEQYETGHYEEPVGAYYDEGEAEADYSAYEEEGEDAYNVKCYTAYEETEAEYSEASQDYQAETGYRTTRQPAGGAQQRGQASAQHFSARGGRLTNPVRRDGAVFRSPPEGVAPRYSLPRKPGETRFPAAHKTQEVVGAHNAEETLHDTSSYSINRFCSLCDMQLVNASEWDKHVFGPKHARHCRQVLEEVGKDGFVKQYGDLPLFTGCRPPSTAPASAWTEETEDGWYEERRAGDRTGARTYEVTSREHYHSYGAARPRPEAKYARDQSAMRDISSLINNLELNPAKKDEIHTILMKHIKENPDLNMETLKSLVKTFMSLQSDKSTKPVPFGRTGRGDSQPRGPTSMVRPARSESLLGTPPRLHVSRPGGYTVKSLNFRGTKSPQDVAYAETEYYHRGDSHYGDHEEGSSAIRSGVRGHSHDHSRTGDHGSWPYWKDRSRNTSFDHNTGFKHRTGSLERETSRDHRNQGRPEVKKNTEPDRNKPVSRSSSNYKSSSSSLSERNEKDSKLHIESNKKDKINDKSNTEVKEEPKPGLNSQQTSTNKGSASGVIKTESTKDSSVSAPKQAGKDVQSVTETKDSKMDQKANAASQLNKNNIIESKDPTPKADSVKGNGKDSKPDDNKKSINEKEKTESNKIDTKPSKEGEQKPKDTVATEKVKTVTENTKVPTGINQPKVHHFSTNNLAEKTAIPGKPLPSLNKSTSQTSKIQQFSRGAESRQQERNHPLRGRGRPFPRGQSTQYQQRPALKQEIEFTEDQTYASETYAEVDGRYEEQEAYDKHYYHEKPMRGRGLLPVGGRGLLGEPKGLPLLFRGQPRVLRAGSRGAAAMRGRSYVSSAQAADYGYDDTLGYEVPVHSRSLTPGMTIRGRVEAMGTGRVRARGGVLVRGRGEYRGISHMRGRGEVRGRGIPPATYRRSVSPSQDPYAEHGIKRPRTF